MNIRALAAWTAVVFAGMGMAQDEGFRFFLDTKGVGEQEARPAATPLAFTNPTVGQGTGVGRFYFYLEFGTANQPFSGVNLRIRIDGDATFQGGKFYNHTVYGVPRWQAVVGGVSPQSGATDWYIGSASRIGGGGPGYGNYPPGEWEANDTHFRADDGSPFGTTLLGYFDVAHGTNDAAPAGIHIMTGDSGCAGPTLTSLDIVYFGFGDAGTTNKGSRTSPDPDGYIAPVPEPATILAIAAAAALSRLRRN